jgi:acid phosphatase
VTKFLAVKVFAAVAGAILAALAAVSWHFHPSDTRLTTLPRLVSVALTKLPPAPAHVIVVVEENKEFEDIAGDTSAAPYLNGLIGDGALFTHSYGVAHPSQPNYLALFAGVTNENGDGCPPDPLDTNAPNLAQELAQAHRRFVGYSEDLPTAGSRVCRSGNYARKHVPWADFTNIAGDENLPYSALPPYSQLPAVAFIIPNQLDDMHSASIQRGDAWLRTHIKPLVDWGMKHDTLVIITWDESDDAVSNHIPTIFVGPMVRAGRYDDPITHYRVLRTIEDLYGLGHAGASAGVAPISGIWR